MPGAPRPDKAVRVLIVDASDRGGIATYTAALAAGLRRAGVDARVAAPGARADGSPPLFGKAWGPDVQALSRLAVRRLRAGELPRSLRALAAALSDVRPRIVHVQTEILPRLDPIWFRAVRKLGRARVVVTAHDPVPHEGGVGQLRREAARWRAADLVIVHEEEPKQLVASCAAGTPVTVVPIDLPLGGPPVDRGVARDRLGLGGPGRPHVALLFGLLRPYKGLALLRAAWPAVAAARPDARLLVVGQALDDEPELGQLALLPGVEIRQGFVREEDVDVWAAAADLILLPYHHGNHSGVLHRAVAAGTPVLASPSLAGECHRTGAGRVVPLDAAAWSEALIEALGDDPLPAPKPVSGMTTVAGTIACYRRLLGLTDEETDTGWASDGTEAEASDDEASGDDDEAQRKGPGPAADGTSGLDQHDAEREPGP